MQFTSDVSGDSYTSTWFPAGVTEYQRYFDAIGFNHLVSSPTLPGGARIIYVELDFCDNNALDHARPDGRLRLRLSWRLRRGPAHHDHLEQ